MTREEAIRILDNLKPTNTKSSFDAYVVGEAITMAIKALEQEPMLDKIRAEIDRQRKWLLQAGYTAYNLDIAFNSIKSVIERNRYDD